MKILFLFLLSGIFFLDGAQAKVILPRNLSPFFLNASQAPVRQAKITAIIKKVWFEQVGNTPSMIKRSSLVCQKSGNIDVYDFRSSLGGGLLSNFASCSAWAGTGSVTIKISGFLFLLKGPTDVIPFPVSPDQEYKVAVSVLDVSNDSTGKNDLQETVVPIVSSLDINTNSLMTVAAPIETSECTSTPSEGHAPVFTCTSNRSFYFEAGFSIED